MEQEGKRQPEQESKPYYLAARFATRKEAAVPYYAVQEATKEGDLSGCRFMRQWEEPNDKPWYVVVIGERPSEAVHQRLQEALSLGEMTSLPEEGIRFLLLRRLTETMKGPWVERHYGEQGLQMRYAEIKFSRRPKGKGHPRRRH